MKLALFNDFVPGVVIEDRIVDVSAVVDEVMGLPAHDRMPAIIAAFERLRPALEAAADDATLPLDQVRLRSPLPRPSKILCAIGNYKEGLGVVVRPIDLFLKSPASIIGPGDTVVLPPVDATIFHHEAELAVVIGARAKDLSPEQVPAAIFGYTCLIDVSARGPGRGTGFQGKSFDSFGPCGPWIVTKDEIDDAQRLRVRLWVNDGLNQDYSTDDMEHPVAELIAWASGVSTLEPGDLLACGTNHQGLGALQDGDTAVIEVERIGRMTVQVRDPSGRSWPRGVDAEIGQRVRETRLQAIAEREAARV